ncbi:hypothetical protein BX070DRAFT_6070 [Coemansia spiralis]|nr:hypothetical protein BX070DRAFT_6070 [Coemansia spiralis]
MDTFQCRLEFIVCDHFVYVQLFVLLPWIFYECTKRLMQIQEHIKASTYILMIVLSLHLLSTCPFVWSPVGFGFLCAAVANVMPFWAMLAAIISYSWCSSARAA